MKIDKIKDSAARFSSLVEGWVDDSVSTLERDLALDYLKSLYDQVRELRQGEVNEPIDNATHSIDIEEIMPFSIIEPEADEIPAEKPQPKASQPQVEPEPTIVEEPQPPIEQESVFEEVEIEHTPAEIEVSVEASQPEPEPMVEVLQPQPEITIEASQPEPIAEEPVEKPTKSAKATKNESEFTLFDLGTVETRRKKQSVIMSLYGDAPEKAEDNKTATNAPIAEQEPEPIDDPQLSEEEQTISVMLGDDTDSTATQPEPESIQEPVDTAAATEQPTAEPSADEQEQEYDDEDMIIEEFDITDEGIVPNNGDSRVLGETLNSDVKRVGDLHPMSSTIADAECSNSIDSIKDAITTNDKFMLIRELFSGNADEYQACIDSLDGIDDFDEGIIFIAENYAWNPSSDGAKLIIDLLERKLIKR